jgi:hypothetical protein
MPVDLSKFEGMTPGKWEVVRPQAAKHAGLLRVYVKDAPGGSFYIAESCRYWSDDVEANFAAIAAVPDLIAEVRELRALFVIAEDK